MADNKNGQAQTPKPLRILEIGDDRFFKSVVPDQTDFFWTGYKPRANRAIAFGPIAFLHSLRRLRRKEYDLVVVHVPRYAPWHPRTILTALRDWHLSAPRGLFAIFSWLFIRHFHDVPMIAIDLGDSFGVGRHAFRTIDACRAYFKRELPADRWQVFYKTGHSTLPGKRWRMKPKNQQRVEKLRPLSYGSYNSVERNLPAEKTIDVFFAGAVAGNSTVRTDGIEALRTLRDEGYVIDIPEERLPLNEFHRRVARAWLVWSPSGLGWDCSRHYEIAWLGTVPVMNYPTIERDQPLRDGEHCILYGVEPGELANAVRAALTDKPRLARMGRAAAEHCFAHHTAKARAERVAVTVLGRRLDGSPAQSSGNKDGKPNAR